MASPSPESPNLPAEALRDACQTISGQAPPSDHLMTRLQYIANLLADAQRLPACPILLWRQRDQSVRHQVIGEELVVGRQPGPTGLAIAEDKLLSRRHFLVQRANAQCTLEDLNSHNGTAVNRTDNRIKRHALHDGDIIYAGKTIFVYLDQGRIS